METKKPFSVQQNLTDLGRLQGKELSYILLALNMSDDFAYKLFSNNNPSFKEIYIEYKKYCLDTLTKSKSNSRHRITSQDAQFLLLPSNPFNKTMGQLIDVFSLPDELGCKTLGVPTLIEYATLREVLFQAFNNSINAPVNKIQQLEEPLQPMKVGHILNVSLNNQQIFPSESIYSTSEYLSSYKTQPPSTSLPPLRSFFENSVHQNTQVNNLYNLNTNFETAQKKQNSDLFASMPPREMLTPMKNQKAYRDDNFFSSKTEKKESSFFSSNRDQTPQKEVRELTSRNQNPYTVDNFFASKTELKHYKQESGFFTNNGNETPQKEIIERLFSSNTHNTSENEEEYKLELNPKKGL